MTPQEAGHRWQNWCMGYMQAAGRQDAETAAQDESAGELAASVLCEGTAPQGRGDRVARLMWWYRQERQRTEGELDLAAHHVRRAVRPLFEARCSKAQIEAETRRANDGRLPWDQIVIILIDEAARMKRQRRHHAT